jgi:hypothetical protein
MRNCSTILATIFVTASCICLTACVSSYVPTERQRDLPLNRAWVDARKVEYVTTDISDVEMAKMAGVNYVPRLADAVPRNGAKSLLARVQISGWRAKVFFSRSTQPARRMQISVTARFGVLCWSAG